MDLQFVSYLLILTAIVLFIVTFHLPKRDERYITIRIGNKTIKAEIADTPAKMMIGLMKKDNITFDEGMIFIFEREGYPGFWMLNMSFPIDIIWIDKDRKIVDITRNAKPCILNCTIYKPKEKVLYVLEVKAGFVDKYKIKEGMEVKFY
ncbi:MAG: DUF192 domain-containing protein [Candidatus Aenigmarchaeota archaeon]|nr:DUF192 domain-containing protein [Candidatus Aenigmarchaeota archaeon]